ncbi:MAG: hypothetical protein JNK02_01930 [Planctomycetes bacterium]|nr:hypothetical protein [Planctomycetota bacterium]
MRAVLPLVLLALASCASTEFDRAPLTCDTGFGTVRGFAAEDVEEVGRLVRDLAPRVQEILRPEHAEPVRVVVLDTPADPNAKAFTHEFVREGHLVDRFIVVGSEGRHLRAFLVAHECVHWWADGPWDRLPLALEEGLADLIACQLDPVGREAKLYDLAHVPPAASFEEIEAALRVTRETWAGLTAAERERAYWVGYVVASRLGVDGLRELAEQAALDGVRFVPPERVVDRVGLGRNVQTWNASIHRSPG